MSTILDTPSTTTDDWSSDMTGRVYGGETDSPIFAQTAKAHNGRLDARDRAAEEAKTHQAEFEKMMEEATAVWGRKSFISAEVVPVNTKKSPGEFFSQMFSAVKRFFKEV